MRILHTVEFYHPSVGGAQEVVKQISERLVQRGHEVTVATTEIAARAQSVINGVRVKHFPISGNAVRGFHGQVRDYQEFLLNSQFDIMMNYAMQQWTTDLAFPVLARLPYRRVVAPCGFSGLRNPQYAEYFDRLPDILREYDHLIFHSDSYQDIEFARTHAMTHHTVIPNGASENEFEPLNPTFRRRYQIPEDVPLLLTVGSHTGIKGHRLTIDAFRRARIGRAVLVIIGNTVAGARGCLPGCHVRSRWAALRSFGHKRVLLLDPPRADVVAAYQAADLFVFGSNVECSPLVLFEAMASKTPFVTVACGNAAEIASWGNGGIVIPTVRTRDGQVDADPRIMAQSIENLILNPSSRDQLKEQGHRAWQQRFTWGKVALRYEQLYQAVIAGTAGCHEGKGDVA